MTAATQPGGGGFLGATPPDPLPPFPWFRVLRWVAAIGLVLAVMVVGYLGSLEDDEAMEAFLTARCHPVPDAVAGAVEQRVDTGHHILRHWMATPSDDHPGLWFVSAERLPPNAPRGATGRILTWTTADPFTSGDDYRAAEGIADEHSTWPAADEVHVTDDGGLESRRCVRDARTERWRDLIHRNRGRA